MLQRTFLGWATCLAVLFMTSLLALAGDRPVDKRDLQGVSPKRHRLLFSTIGGAAVGMGVGALIGGGGTAWWDAAHTGRSRQVGSNQP